MGSGCSWGWWKTPPFGKPESAIIGTTRAMLLATDRQGYAGCYGAVRDMDMRRTVALIRCPTLVIAGQHDTVTLPSHSELISATVPEARRPRDTTSQRHAPEPPPIR